MRHLECCCCSEMWQASLTMTFKYKMLCLSKKVSWTVTNIMSNWTLHFNENNFITIMANFYMDFFKSTGQFKWRQWRWHFWTVTVPSPFFRTSPPCVLSVPERPLIYDRSTQYFLWFGSVNVIFTPITRS